MDSLVWESLEEDTWDHLTIEDEEVIEDPICVECGNGLDENETEYSICMRCRYEQAADDLREKRKYSTS